MNANAMDPLRSAALTVHALAEVDRAWVLSALTVGQRAAIDPLLAELESLGIPRDPELLAAAAPAPARTTSQPWPASLDAHGRRTLARVLDGEPVAVSSMLLGACEGPARAAVVDALALRSNERSTAQGPEASPAPALRKALLRALEEATSREVTSTPEIGRWLRARTRLARLWRRP